MDSFTWQNALDRLFNTGPVVCLSLIVIFGLYRHVRYLTEALHRTNEEGLKRQNAIVKTLLESFSRGHMPNLKDLAEDTDRDWSVKS